MAQKSGQIETRQINQQGVPPLLRTAPISNAKDRDRQLVWASARSVVFGGTKSLRKLTGASVVAFWVPHPKVSHGTGGEAHAYLTNVVALQEDEELGPAFNAAVVLGAPVAAFGAGWRPLGADCGNMDIEPVRKEHVSDNNNNNNSLPE